MTSSPAPPDFTSDEVFDLAAALIEANGLHSGDFYPTAYGQPATLTGPVVRTPWKAGMPVCAIAALVIAQHPGAEEVSVEDVEDFEDDLHVEAFAAWLDVTSDAIANWSDELDATAVVDALRAAAVDRREQAAGATG